MLVGLWIEYTKDMSDDQVMRDFVARIGFPPDHIEHIFFGSNIKIFAGPIRDNPSPKFDIVEVEDRLDPNTGGKHESIT